MSRTAASGANVGTARGAEALAAPRAHAGATRAKLLR